MHKAFICADQPYTHYFLCRIIHVRLSMGDGLIMNDDSHMSRLQISL